MRNSPSAAILLCNPRGKEVLPIRIEIVLKDEVGPAALRRALDRAIVRYPYFAVRFDEVGGDPFLKITHNPRQVVIREGSAPFVLGSEETNRHVIAFGYEKNRLFFDCFHALADGTGWMNFLKTLLYCYVLEEYGEKISPDGIIMPDSQLRDGEDVDPLLNIPLPTNPITVTRPDTSRAFLMSEHGVSGGEPTLFKFRLPEEAFVRYSKSSDASPATMFAVFLAQAIFSLHADEDFDVAVSMARNYRSALSAENAHHSLANSFMIKYPSRSRNLSVEQLGSISRGVAFLNSDRDVMLNQLQPMRGLFSALYSLKTREDIHRFFARTGGGRISGTVSYVGKCLPESLNPYVSEVYSCVEVSEELITEVNAIGGAFTCAAMQCSPDGKYVRAMVGEMKKEGIDVELDGPVPLVTPSVDPSLII